MMYYPQNTSIMTIAKEKTSAALLYVPSSFMISGAVHRAVYSRVSEALHVEFKFRVAVARPKSAIRARPVTSTRTFDWVHVNRTAKRGSEQLRTPLRSP